MTKKVGKVVKWKKPIKGSSKRVLKMLVDYLKTDCYLFAPFISPSSESSIRGVEQRESPGKNNKSLLKKMEQYLKSDSYMYGPCVIPPSSTATSKGAPGTVIHCEPVLPAKQQNSQKMRFTAELKKKISPLI